MFVRGQNSGGAKQGTSIWTTSYSPTSAWGSTQASAPQTLSKGLSNFSEIALKYRLSTSDATEYFVRVDATKLGSGNTRFTFGGNVPSLGVFARFYTWTSDTTFTVSQNQQINAASAQNTYFIPLEIIGYE